MLEKTRSRAASEVSTDDLKILEGNTETFVGYDQTESEAKITRIRKVDSKRGVMYQIVLDTHHFILKAEDKWEIGVLVSANETIQIIDTKKEENNCISLKLRMRTVVAKVDSKPRSDTTKSLCDALDASGIEKHIGNTCGTKGFVSKSEPFAF
jgi:alanyl-tRNA synthetase